MSNTSLEMATTTTQFQITYSGKSLQVTLPHQASVLDLVHIILRNFDLSQDTIKLILPPKRGGLIRLGDHIDARIVDIGVTSGATYRVLGSSAAAVGAVMSAKDEPRIAGFDHELRREAARRAGVAHPRAPPAGPYTFKNFRAWQTPGLTPSPAEALAFLHRLAADPGVQGVMSRHRWRVGTLSEMPPEGKVGVSPACILGVNINAGQEISLRLRTDDLRGFRRYDRICETLMHELAHMVHSEHDNAFKTLNSELRSECERLQRHASTSGEWTSEAASLDFAKSSLPSGAHPVKGERLGGTSERSRLHQFTGSGDAARNAIAAVTSSAGAREDGSGARTPDPNGVGAAARQFRKNDAVLYTQRDGSQVPAKVIAVDLSLDPPAYSIELSTGVRETEGHRLEPARPEEYTSADPLTADKEAAARALGE